jgi:hypothetical protein
MDRGWALNELIHFIEDGKCTPFIGAGANASLLPFGREIAMRWAQKYNYLQRDLSFASTRVHLLYLINDVSLQGYPLKAQEKSKQSKLQRLPKMRSFCLWIPTAIFKQTL